ncbi:hypothetical protein LU689_12435 [Pseudomonas asiatica]|uniref:hypothetical protein n=1 Tax=Pseudomonas asiatica TaxID=2219225 RepID=UPI001E5D6C7B|nr:hypothetical protein [Pseudomonas asiatica]MCE0850719.1 hypothetical protein [Pseudomonas asiatica]
MSERFEREERYIVFKVKDLSEHKLGWVRDVIRLNDIPTVDAVVVEADWPEYEPTWAAIERRVTRAHWNGIGLPPVGTVCEYKHPSGWRPVEVFAVKPNSGASASVLFTYEEGTWQACAEPSWFRPIRTPEQIAAEQRKAAIDAMAADAQLDFSAGELLTAREYVECAIAALHDAGYRKQEAP